ncbi:MAG: GTPase HflX [Gammaproteobacteria bacterium]|nr:GTPase HflX [Gammaproteobacteria bacterium]
MDLSHTSPDSTPAVLVHIDFRNPRFNEELDEFRQLAESASLSATRVISGHRSVPHARLFVGTGKVEEIRAAIAETRSRVVVVNHELSPGQERNLEKACGCRVLDRIGLILEIFAQRARSYEGKLQVELARLERQSTRLVRGWTHLERQKGGIGLRGGPGETQLETDRRLIARRMKNIHARLEKVRHQRQQGRRLRRRNTTPLVSLVGYTNAGKSTLFNRLTGAMVYAADKLFATLDPTLRQSRVAPDRTAVLSDTVGFIRHIPHGLIKSFHATLQEVAEADLLLHVVDANAEQRDLHMQQVNGVIEEIGAGAVPQIIVYNKIDMNPQLQPRVEMHNGGAPAVWLSALSGTGVDALCGLMARVLQPLPEIEELHLPPGAGALRARLFEFGAVSREECDERGGWIIQVSIDPRALRRIAREQGLEMDALRTGCDSL